jgi:DNA-binding beta-propeller fold protein YncE
MRSVRAPLVQLFNASLALAFICLAAAGGRFSTAEARQSSTSIRHYEYVFPNHAMYVYDADDGFRLVRRVPLRGVVGVRGVVASPSTHMLYVSYGAYGGPGTTGRLLAYNLLTDSVVYRRSYSRGVDNMAIDPSGSRIYMPDGEDSHDNVWSVIAAHTGKVIGEIRGGKSPHETIVGLNGERVYLGGTKWPYLEVASTTTDRIVKRIGPLKAGVRPFTINGRETLAYTTATRFLGFQVSSITTGRVLYTVRFGARFRRNLNGSRTPSHGISLTPNERQIWVMDWPHHHVHVFDVAGVPQRPPREIANIKLVHSNSDGWIQMSRDGCFVYVGDSGDVLSTRTFKPVAYLKALSHTKQSLEIDWRQGLPVATSTRTGLGYVTRGADPPAPKCSGI